MGFWQRSCNAFWSVIAPISTSLSQTDESAGAESEVELHQSHRALEGRVHGTRRVALPGKNATVRELSAPDFDPEAGNPRKLSHVMGQRGSDTVISLPAPTTSSRRPTRTTRSPEADENNNTNAHKIVIGRP